MDEEWRTNKWEFVVTNVMEDEALSYEKEEEEENNPQRMHQTDNGCCESVKMQQISTEEVKEVPFDDQMSVEGSWRLRELRSVVGLQKKTQSVFENAER